MRLSIFIDEKWSRQDAQTPLPWVLHDLHGEQRNAGQQPLAELPAAATCQVIAAASAVFLTQVPLPTRQTQKLRQLLPYAVEEKLMCDPERVHVALGPINEKGRADVAVVDREWMQVILERFRLTGRKPQAMWVETLLPPWRLGDWTVVWDGREGFVRTGPAAGFLLDGGAADTAPQALQLALQAGEGQSPERLLFYAAQPTAMPNVRLWETQLGSLFRRQAHGPGRTVAKAAGSTCCKGILPFPRQGSGRVYLGRPWSCWRPLPVCRAAPPLPIMAASNWSRCACSAR